MQNRKSLRRKKKMLTPTAPVRATYALRDLLTDVEAADVLRLKPHTLRVWRTTHRQPALPYVRIGRTIRYFYGDLLGFAESCRNPVAALKEGTSESNA
jgi:hypothetical protein